MAKTEPRMYQDSEGIFHQQVTQRSAKQFTWSDAAREAAAEAREAHMGERRRGTGQGGLGQTWIQHGGKTSSLTTSGESFAKPEHVHEVLSGAKVGDEIHATHGDGLEKSVHGTISKIGQNAKGGMYVQVKPTSAQHVNGPRGEYKGPTGEASSGATIHDATVGELKVVRR